MGDGAVTGGPVRSLVPRYGPVGTIAPAKRVARPGDDAGRGRSPAGTLLETQDPMTRTLALRLLTASPARGG